MNGLRVVGLHDDDEFDADMAAAHAELIKAYGEAEKQFVERMREARAALRHRMLVQAQS